MTIIVYRGTANGGNGGADNGGADNGGER